jgi:GH25 family lysozyme M1 (1,4-beta-N-acetylmuramidase)
MLSPRRIILGAALALGVLTAAVAGPFPNPLPNNPSGVDVYAGTGTINWASVKSSGISFAFLKATEGTYYQDANYATNRANANAQGIVIGAYHFAEPGTTPTVAANAIAQANYFYNFAQPAKGDIQMVCDWETVNGLSSANMGAWLTAFCGQIQSLTHTPATIYCSPSFWSENMPSNWSNPNCALWIANWQVNSPSIPAPWASSGYAFWQYNDDNTVPGISGGCDVDTFNGSMSTLLKFTYPRNPSAGRR